MIIIWKLLALAAGWAGARDWHGHLVVYRDGYHYSGRDAWRRAGRAALGCFASALIESVVTAALLAAIFIIAGAVSGRL